MRYPSLMIAALLATACTQQPAQISLKGSQSYQRGATPSLSAGRGYSAPASSAYKPVAQHHLTLDTTPAVSAARIDSIGVSDLPPPSAVKDTPRLTDDTPAKPVHLKESSSNFIWPVEGRVISAFGPKGAGKSNDGINIAAPEGEPVYASAGGEVVYVGDQLKGYGHMVIIKHNGTRHSTYAHLKKTSVSRYDRIKQGEIVGYVGASGGVKEPQLHFAIRDNKQPVNPEKLLPARYAGL